MNRRIASLFVLLFSCGGGASSTSKTPAVDPLCRTAEQLAPGSRLAAATDGATPRYAVSVRGPGELVMAGFVNEHDAILLDAKTGETLSRTSTGSCSAKFIKLPTEAGGYGEYCVVFEPTKPKAYSTFDLGFQKEPHTPPTEAQAAEAAKMCK